MERGPGGGDDLGTERPQTHSSGLRDGMPGSPGAPPLSAENKVLPSSAGRMAACK